jgi:hypothetical protein
MANRKMTIGIITALVLIFFFAKEWRSRKVASPRQTNIETVDHTIPDMPIDFGYKCLWFAVKTDDKAKLATLLDLENIQDCNWKVGIDHAYDNEIVFITPAINGWTFACGWALPLHPDDVKIVLEDLSREFGEAQYFMTHRMTNFHCWMKATNGQMQRTYALLGESGENLIIEGEPTAIEKTFNLGNTLSDKARDKAYLDREDVNWPDEDMVMKIAGNWSINPGELESRKDNVPGLGLVGRFKDE